MIPPETPSRHHFVSPLRLPAAAGQPLRLALALLSQAADYARDAGVDPWEFAVEIDELRAIGLTSSDLRWLAARGYVASAIETTLPDSPARTFRPAPRNGFAAGACFVLTPQGIAACQSATPSVAEVARLRGSAPVPNSGAIVPNARASNRNSGEFGYVTAPQSSPDRAVIDSGSHPSSTLASGSSDRPHWDPNRRELTFRGQLVKRYRVPSPNQELILNVFQEESWPDFIDDPLPPEPDIDPHRRLQATIKSLNRHQVNELIRFRGNGGETVFWDVARV